MTCEGYEGSENLLANILQDNDLNMGNIVWRSPWNWELGITIV